MPHLILFDIDGTLVLTGGAGVRAFTRTFEQLFDVRGPFQDVSLAGRTDRLILNDAMQRAGLPPLGHDELEQFCEMYFTFLRDEIHNPGPRKGVMPGVRELLDTLSARDDVTLGLLTGNFSTAARIKLEHFDLWRYFSCGAFADDAVERNDLVEVARRRACEVGAPPVPASQIVIVGDTPLDVACAASAGATAVAVATGGHDAESLRACGADIVFENLSDVAAFLSVLEGERH